MSVRVGVNGFGRIGRYATRMLVGDPNLELVAVNARADNASLAHLLKYDSVHGPYSGSVQATEDGLVVNGQKVTVTRNGPGEWNWGEMGIDIVLETTGKFRDRESCEQHLQAGCSKVLISAPGKNSDATVVMGVNDHELTPEQNIISNASCTTNCLAPAVKVLHESFGLVRGTMTTVHSYTMSQRILDGSHKDMRRGRAAAMSMIPTSTGAAKAVGEVFPEVEGKLDGMAIRVPTPNVSLVDLSAVLDRQVTAEEVNAAFKTAAEGQLQNILGYSEEPLVSVDYVGSIYGGVVDALTTTVTDSSLLKLIVWYDNESGFTHQLLRLASKVSQML